MLVFEDLHWAEEEMLDLVEHLARSVRDVPILILSLARNDLLDRRATWGGGNVRASSLELQALPRVDSETRVDALSRGASAPLSREQRDAVFDTTEGNPLFLEELVSWLEDARSTELPDTLRGLVAARLDGRIGTHE